jgi:5-formyltetrahydrofolate cyclo-ligase
LQISRISSLDLEFVVGDYGVREPSPEVREIVSPSCVDFVIAPGLAFDVYGNRMGYGGGYYDKLLKELSKDVVQIGVGYDFQVLDLVPHSELDKSVQFVITETKTLRCQSI